MKTYFFQKGIRQLAKEITGKENIYLGIRPYGFHAGNMLPHVLYPVLLSEEVKRIGKKPEFNLFVFINDWEQDGLAGPDVEKHPFNVFPKNTTFQYTSDPDHDNMNIVDRWEPIIVNQVKEVSRLFPGVKVRSVRNSQMKKSPVMRKHLLFTIQNPQILANILRKYTDKEVLREPLSYALAVCPDCKKTRGRTTYSHGKVHHFCTDCHKDFSGDYLDFDYWLYHKPLALPRLEIFDIDICITGLDHYNERDFTVRQELIKQYGSKAKFPRTLYTQVVLGRDGNVMGKSRGNAETISIAELRDLFNKYPNEKTLRLGS